MRKEKKKVLESIAEKFTFLDEQDKKFMDGYIIGKVEERSKWENMVQEGEKVS